MLLPSSCLSENAFKDGGSFSRINPVSECSHTPQEATASTQNQKRLGAKGMAWFSVMLLAPGRVPDRELDLSPYLLLQSKLSLIMFYLGCSKLQLASPQDLVFMTHLTHGFWLRLKPRLLGKD